MTPKILFGPYGTRLSEIGRTLGESNLSDPIAILNGGACRDAIVHVARDNVYSGATVGTVNAFGLRGLLHKLGNETLYKEAMMAQHEALVEAINGFSHRIEIVVSLGPENDCYEPNSAPERNEAEDFHSQQLAIASKLGADSAWFETVNTSEEAIGMARAAARAKMAVIISFVLNQEGQLLSGEQLSDAIKAVDSASNNFPLGYSVNCCPIEAIEPALLRNPETTFRVIAAYPNATSLDQRTFADLDRTITVREPEITASYTHYLAKRYGLETIGGCCGYTGKDIAELNKCIHDGFTSNILPMREFSHRYCSGFGE